MIPILSFFTGAGLLDLGMHNAGFDVIWRNEFNLSFVKGFQTGMSSHLGVNSSDISVNTESINHLTTYKIRNEAFSSKVWPSVFGVVGGPPCPDFSTGGKNKGESGDNGRLTGVYFDHLLGLKPSFFIFENVKGILSTEKHRKYLTKQLHKIKTEYVFDIKLMNSLDIGVPQDRERVIILGVHKSFVSDFLPATDIQKIKRRNQSMLKKQLHHKEIVKLNWFKWPYNKKFHAAKKRFLWPTTHPFQSIHEKPKDIPLELCVWNYIHDLNGLNNQDEFFRPKSDKFSIVDEGDVSRKSFKRLHRWRYSPTVAYGNNEVHLHPFEARRLSVREAMRLQTIPDTYNLPREMTLSDKFKTIGNGVPVKLAEALAIKLFGVFYNNEDILGAECEL